MRFSILNSYSISDSPSNNTVDVASSARIHPIDHMSISCVYLHRLKSSSGALYHNLLASRPDLSLSFGSSGVYWMLS